jgi:hypothetical protein
MNNTLLYTLPQWFIFAAVFVIVYGWIENKKPFRIVGYIILVLLGVFSLFIISGDYFAANEFLTPEEIAREELDDEIMNEVPFQAKLLPAFISFIAAAIFAFPSLVLDIRNHKKYRWFVIISGLIALLGFFIIVGAIKSL